MRSSNLRVPAFGAAVLVIAGCTSYSPTTSAAMEWEQTGGRPARALVAGDTLGQAVYATGPTLFDRDGATRFAGAEQSERPGR